MLPVLEKLLSWIETKPKISPDEIRYKAGWDTADTIISNAPIQVAAQVIERKHSASHPSFYQGMVDRLNKESK